MNKTDLIKERREAVSRMQQYLETIDIGNEIRMVLDNAGLSDQFLADIIRCDRTNIVQICNRKNKMEITQLLLISVALQFRVIFRKSLMWRK